MAASPPEAGRAPAGPLRTVQLALLLSLLPPAAVAQEPAEAVLRGRALLADSALTVGTVVLHRVTELEQGPLDSIVLGPGGGFEFALPNVPHPDARDVYFASLRHQGIDYFGPAITLPVQLDTVYEIRAYDTLVVGPGGADLPIGVRSLFLEEDSGAWLATDVFSIRNTGDRTLVANGAGAVWSYPLPPGASDFTFGRSEFVVESATFEDGSVVLRAPVPPGERVLVLRYRVPDPFVAIPTPGRIESLDVLVREPAPPLEAVGLAPVSRVELEPGSTYRRYSATELTGATIRLERGDTNEPPPVEWFAVLLAMVLTGAGLVYVRRGGGGRVRVASSPAPGGREELLVEIARLDEAFERKSGPTDAERAAYARRRADLLRRVRRSG